MSFTPFFVEDTGWRIGCNLTKPEKPIRRPLIGLTERPLTELFRLYMQHTGLLAAIAFYVVGFAVCALPGLVAAGRGTGPWMVCTAISSTLFLMLFYFSTWPAVFFGAQFHSPVWAPSLLLVALSWLFAWAAIREGQEKAAEPQLPRRRLLANWHDLLCELRAAGTSIDSLNPDVGSAVERRQGSAR
jgi:hypothetical protein